MASDSSARRAEAGVAAGVMLTGLALGAGALRIPSAAGYGGIGPNFLPWTVSLALLACGLLMLREAMTGGLRQRPPPEGSQRAWWPGLLWVSAGLLSSAALIEKVGFILSCALCYLLASQGLRRAAGQRVDASSWAVDAFAGLLIAAPVFWTFTRFLGISLPGLTSTGWL